MALDRRRPKPAAYHLMSSHEKQAYARQQVRETSIRCPQCEMQLMPVDLLTHIRDRCAGRPEPAAGAKWVSWADALALGVPRVTMHRWVMNGFVRFIGERQDRKYLLRDLALKIAQRRGLHRR